MIETQSDVILLKMGEIVLKGHNRYVFEAALRKNIKYRLSKIGSFSVSSSQSTVYISDNNKEVTGQLETSLLDRAYHECGKIFGIAGLVRAYAAEKNFDSIVAVATKCLGARLSSVRSFKVEAKRSDKTFSMNSPEICRELGGVLLESFPHLKVDVHNPDLTVVVEVRETAAYIHAGSETGPGGMPVGSNGRAMLMLSGGIDSPVAGIMMAKRGLQIDAVHFHSYPYTSERARQKVVELAEIMTAYTGDIRLHVVPFTKAQEEIRDHCTEDLFTIIMRRIMIKIGERIAIENNVKALVSGESLGQVASQTLEAIGVTNQAAQMPIFRPCVGMDKEEIVTLSRRYGTYNKSCEPYEDCCTLFAPKHPQTKPKLDVVLADELNMDMEKIISEAIAGTEIIKVTKKNNFSL